MKKKFYFIKKKLTEKLINKVFETVLFLIMKDKIK